MVNKLHKISSCHFNCELYKAQSLYSLHYRNQLIKLCFFTLLYIFSGILQNFVLPHSARITPLTLRYPGVFIPKIITPKCHIYQI